MSREATDETRLPVRHVPLRVWREASQPHTRPIWIASCIIPGAVAWANGVFDLITFLLEALLCWALLTLVIFADDYGDFEKGVDNEDRVGQVTPMQRGDIGFPEMKRALVATAVLVLATGAALLLYSCLCIPTSTSVIVGFFVTGAVCVAAAFGYTMGKHPYGYAGLGEAAAFLFFGLVAGGGGYWLYAHTFDWAVLCPAGGAGLLLAASINLQNIYDIPNDVAFGKVTLAARLGKRRAAHLQYTLIALAVVGYAAYPLLSAAVFPVRYLYWLLFIPLIIHTVRFRRHVADDDVVAMRASMRPLFHIMLALALGFAVCTVLPI